jgi:hypothetical protein
MKPNTNPTEITDTSNSSSPTTSVVTPGIEVPTNETVVDSKHKHEAREWMTLLDGSKVPVAAKIEVEPDLVFLIAEGQGKHAMEAQQESMDDKGKFSMSNYTSTLMSQLITMNGDFLPPEFFKEMSMRVYNKISMKFMEINF